jgi:spermidine synthase
MMMWLLFEPHPRHIVQLGLGAGALTKFCYRHFSQARITAVDLNPQVIAICRDKFSLPANDARLSVLEADAMDFVTDPANRGSIDILQIDLYDEHARKPVFDTPEFYQACADCLSPAGMMTMNLFGEAPIYDHSVEAMLSAFDAVAWLPEVHEGNVVVIAFKKAPYLDFSSLYERASEIRRTVGLPAKSWVDGLKEWMADA